MHPQSTRVKVCDMTQFLTVFQSTQLGLSYPDFSFVVYQKVWNVLPVLIIQAQFIHKMLTVFQPRSLEFGHLSSSSLNN